jgi:uncharacterized protein with von Willebrand factor type A (vWA) domain
MALVYKSSKWSEYLWKTTANEDRAAHLDAGVKAGFSQFPVFGQEVYSRLYQENTARLDAILPENKWAEKAHDLLQEVPEFNQLSRQCRGDRFLSDLATSALGDSVLHALPKPADKALEAAPRLRKEVDGLSQAKAAGVPCGKELKKAEKALQQALTQAEAYTNGIDDSTMRQAIRKGVDAAHDEISQYEAACSAFGYGAGTESMGGDLASKKQVYDRIKTDPKLRKLLEVAGKLRMIARKAQKNKANYSRDEITDIIQSDDLSRLLPAEMIKFLNPHLKSLFFKDFMEKALLTYELSGKEPEGKGPIVVAIDNSGSMEGDNEIWSKAVALALLDVARHQKRAFAIIHFDGKVRHTYTSTPTSPIDTSALLDAMAFFSGGGTSFNEPMQAALDMITTDKNLKKADVILITDGDAPTDLAGDIKAQFTARDATVFGVGIGGITDCLRTWCHECLTVDAANTLFAL